MSNNAKGGQTLRERNIIKYGSYEAYKVHMQLLASVGGKHGNTGGYASDKIGKDGLNGPERARVNGVIGGKISRRKPKVVK